MTFLYVMGGLITTFATIAYQFFKKNGVYNKAMPSTDNIVDLNVKTDPTATMTTAPKLPQVDSTKTTSSETHTSPTRANSPTTSDFSGFPKMIVKWADAVEHWEGAKPESNNPGNLKYSSLTASWGATKGRQAADGGNFCQFADYQKGKVALCNFLLLGAEGQLIISHPKPCTLDAFTTRFAGNPPQGYKNGVAQMLGVSLSTDISTLI